MSDADDGLIYSILIGVIDSVLRVFDASIEIVANA